MKTINAVLALALLFGSPPLAGLQAQTRTPAGVAGSQPVPDAAAQLPAATHGGSTSGTPSAAVEGTEAAKVVNINSASEKELLSLPDVTKQRAEAIIQHRPYKDINELV